MSRYYLSVLAVFRNESHIMKEWICHYIMEGVDHFYLLNNFSTDNYTTVLKEFEHCVRILYIRKYGMVDSRRFRQIHVFENSNFKERTQTLEFL